MKEVKPQWWEVHIEDPRTGKWMRFEEGGFGGEFEKEEVALAVMRQLSHAHSTKKVRCIRFAAAYIAGVNP